MIAVNYVDAEDGGSVLHGMDAGVVDWIKIPADT
jgi:hypothetical protein